tara:strand:- start:567 stop:1106 length:540 start_codon:yes stop_codon:yes gene_type:complete
MANPLYGQNKADDLLDGVKNNQAIIDKTVVKSSVAITITATANSDGTVAQPAGTTLMSVIISPQTIITTAGNSGDDLDFSMGTSAGGAQILAAKAILDDGGAAVSLAAGGAYEVISSGLGQAANAFVGLGTATSEASPVVGALYSAAARDVHFRFTPLANNLAVTGTVDVICTFVKTNA